MPTYELTEVQLSSVKRRAQFRTLLIGQSSSGELELVARYEVKTVDATGEVLKTEWKEKTYNEAMMRDQPGFMTVFSILRPLSRKMLAEECPELVVESGF